MKPVNLLPGTERPRAVAAAPENASKIVMGCLAALVIAVAAFVVTKNQATDRRDKIAQAEQEKAQAEARTQGLKAYGDFSKIKQTRVTSISDLATKRFDWERLMRELALVLPEKVWVTEVNGKVAGATADASSGASSTTPSSPASGSSPTAAAGGSTSLTVAGCAPSQDAVAATMVRLRNLAGAEEVDLQNSQAPDAAEGAATSDSGSGGAGCGTYLRFSAVVSFAAPSNTTKKPKSVPSRLGGGS
ncbi:MAG TPA: PilN domain-containing protein [Thermoleophilaceae bacterium]|nr:PilN domain-containing protein [Thermoleophilaceae bacterium]